jgi:arsenate reductase
METGLKKVLFLCTGNSCRSQMAEGFLKKFRKTWRVESAGINPKGLNPLSVAVMLEKGIDISKQKSKNVNDFTSDKFDYVITVCDDAKEKCPYFPDGTNYIHWSLEDPDLFKGSLKGKINKFRKIRDEIENKITDFLKSENIVDVKENEKWKKKK